jgi:hypothetical protein
LQLLSTCILFFGDSVSATIFNPLERELRSKSKPGHHLVAYYFLAISAYDVLGWESADVRRLLGEVALLLMYSVFLLLIRAFVLLAWKRRFK